MQPDAQPQQQVIEGQPMSQPIGQQQVMAGQNMTMGNQQIMMIRQRSGGPKIFGVLVILLGGLAVIASAMNLGTDLDGLGGTATAVYYLTTLLSLVSAGVFAYAGVLLFQYKKNGVWFGLGAVGVTVLSGLIQVFFITVEIEEVLGEDAAGIMATLGLIVVGVQAICCTGIVALPMMFNSQDLE